jgi:hypothetical protein
VIGIFAVANKQGFKRHIYRGEIEKSDSAEAFVDSSSNYKGAGKCVEPLFPQWRLVAPRGGGDRSSNRFAVEESRTPVSGGAFFRAGARYKSIRGAVGMAPAIRFLARVIASAEGDSKAVFPPPRLQDGRLSVL